MSSRRAIRRWLGLKILRPLLMEQLVIAHEGYDRAPRNEFLTEKEQERYWMGRITGAMLAMELHPDQNDGRPTDKEKQHG